MMISLIIFSLVLLGFVIISMVMGVGMIQDEEVGSGCCCILLSLTAIACVLGMWGL